MFSSLNQSKWKSVAATLSLFIYFYCLEHRPSLFYSLFPLRLSCIKFKKRRWKVWIHSNCTKASDNPQTTSSLQQNRIIHTHCSLTLTTPLLMLQQNTRQRFFFLLFSQNTPGELSDERIYWWEIQHCCKIRIFWTYPVGGLFVNFNALIPAGLKVMQAARAITIQDYDCMNENTERTCYRMDYIWEYLWIYFERPMKMT